MKWTAEMVREQLPPVKVQLLDGTVVEAITAGRKMPFFCGVGDPKTGVWLGKWTWQAIANALNNDRPLLV